MSCLSSSARKHRERIDNRDYAAEIALENPAALDQQEVDSLAVGQPNWAAAMCRRMLLASLSRIRSGHVLVCDPLGQLQFGPQKDDDLRAVVWIDDLNVYLKMIFGGTTGAADAYLEGKWNCSDLTALLRIMARNIDVLEPIDRRVSFWLAPLRWLQKFQSRNSRSGSRRNIAAHYDLSNQFFGLMLDPRMMYSSAIFERPEMSLEEASTAKLERICRKLQLRPGSRVVEIGTGWGGFAEYAARNFGCHVTTTTISQQQYEYSSRRIADAGLAHQVTLLKKDYRDLTGQYDHLVSIEMIEAVGEEYLDSFFGKCCSLLEPEGTMALQAITIPDDRLDAYRSGVDFIQKYIFPGGFLPSLGLINRSIYRKTDMRILHSEDFGPHYAETLRCWRENLLEHLPQTRQLGMDDAFLRMWEYYLAYCEAGFDERQIGVSQLVLARPGYRGPSLLGQL